MAETTLNNKQRLELIDDTTNFRKQAVDSIRNEMAKDLNMLKQKCTFIQDKNTNEKVSHKIVNKSYFEDQFEGASMPNYSERLVRLNSQTDVYLKVIDYLKKK